MPPLASVCYTFRRVCWWLTKGTNSMQLATNLHLLSRPACREGTRPSWVVRSWLKKVSGLPWSTGEIAMVIRLGELSAMGEMLVRLEHFGLCRVRD